MFGYDVARSERLTLFATKTRALIVFHSTGLSMEFADVLWTYVNKLPRGRRKTAVSKLKSASVLRICEERVFDTKKSLSAALKCFTLKPKDVEALKNEIDGEAKLMNVFVYACPP